MASPTHDGERSGSIPNYTVVKTGKKGKKKLSGKKSKFDPKRVSRKEKKEQESEDELKERMQAECDDDEEWDEYRGKKVPKGVMTDGKLDVEKLKKYWGFDDDFTDWLKKRLDVATTLNDIYTDLTDDKFYKSNFIFETDPRKKRATTILFQLLFPWVCLLAVIGIVWIIYPLIEGVRLPNETFGLMVAYVIPPAGKESVIPLMMGRDIHPIMAAVLICAIDTAFALFITWNLDLLYQVPIVGVLLSKTHAKGRAIMGTFPWIQRLAYVGIVLFTAFPLQGSGGIVATLIGKFIGMPPYRNVSAVAIGAFIGSLLIAYLSNAILDLLISKLGPWGIAIAVGILVIILLAGLWKATNSAFRRLTEDPLKKLGFYFKPEPLVKDEKKKGKANKKKA